MCGRTTHLYTWKEVWRFTQPYRGPENDPPANYNAPPKSTVPVLRFNDNGPLACFMQWWLVPSWSKEPTTKYATFNARSETAAKNNAFRGPFKRRRCVLPVSGFYEWKKLDETDAKGKPLKQPYYITRADGDQIFLAGLWDRWRLNDDDGAEPFDTCTVLTTKPNAEMSSLHNRMPCILEPETLSRWMDTALEDTTRLQSMLGPAPDGILQTHPVDRRVGNVRNNDAELIKAVR